MKSFKRVISCAIVITLLMTMVVSSVISAKAEQFPALDKNKAYLEIGSVTEEQGCMVKLPVYIGNNPGVFSVGFNLKFDSSVLEYCGYENGNVFEKDEVSARLFGDDNDRVAVTVWLNDDLDNMVDNKSNGTVVYLSFIISQTAKTQDYDVDFIDYQSGNYINSLCEEVPFTFGGGKITVAQASKPFTEPSTTTAPPTYTTSADGSYGDGTNAAGFPLINKKLPYLEIGTVECDRGGIVNVPIYLGNNPGIYSLNFSLSYNTSALKYKGVESGDVFSGSELMASPVYNNSVTVVLSPAAIANKTQNGIAVYVKFELNKTAPYGEYEIDFDEYNPNNFFNVDENNVAMTFGKGAIVSVDKTTAPPTTTSVETVIYGDADGNGAVNPKDVMVMRKKFANWDVPNFNEKNADCNADDNFDLKDIMLLRKFIAQWNVKLGPQSK